MTATHYDAPDLYPGGIVIRFGKGAPQGRMHGYQASLRPRVWFLTRTTNSRILQDQSVPKPARG